LRAKLREVRIVPVLDRDEASSTHVECNIVLIASC